MGYAAPMTRRWQPVSTFVVALSLIACGDDSNSESDGDDAGSTDTASGTDGSGGTGSGGSGGSATGAGSTGAATSSDPGTTGGGSAGTTSGGGDTGGTTTGDGATPSSGCDMPDPPSGELTLDVEGQTASYVVSVPPDYDPSNPYPLAFAFHGANRTGPTCQAGDCAGFQSSMENDAILVYMTSLGGPGWPGEDQRELNVTFFEQVLGQMKGRYCVDESRIFAAGTSSGAHFSNILGCRFGDQLLAISPVAGWLPEREGCVGRTAALVIHGVDDHHVQFSSGEEARDFWRERNGCSDQTVPPIDELHARVVENRESHECAVFQDCDPGLPVVWCEHSEGGYDGSTHGWPLFGGQEIWDFVQNL